MLEAFARGLLAFCAVCSVDDRNSAIKTCRSSRYNKLGVYSEVAGDSAEKSQWQLGSSSWTPTDHRSPGWNTSSFELQTSGSCVLLLAGEPCYRRFADYD